MALLQKIRGRHARDFHDAVEKFFRSRGWEVHREYGVSMGYGNAGYIDLVAAKNGIQIALELDNRSPRGKSILKLETLPESEWLTAVLLRNPK